jgi:prepilin-type N-terminal cleavage/methylation domain-containing protein
MKREGFTLIELITVVAIIIILAAIAVPSYLQLTLRAKKARLAADLKVMAAAIEEFKLDWGSYPEVTKNVALSNDVGDWVSPFKELAGAATHNSLRQNRPSNQTIFGEQGGHCYIKPETLPAIRNPLNSKTNGGRWTGLTDQSLIYYCSNTDGSGQDWALWVYGPETSSPHSQNYYYISHSQATLTAQNMYTSTALTKGNRAPAIPPTP